VEQRGVKSKYFRKDFFTPCAVSAFKISLLLQDWALVKKGVIIRIVKINKVQYFIELFYYNSSFF